MDLGAIGTLAAWFPLQLLSPNSRLLEGTLAALEEATFHEDALLVNTGHSGWGTYLNMRIAGCHLLCGSEKGWRLMRWLLSKASPTHNWPEAIHPLTGGGSAGDGHHGWASAEWLLLVRAMLLQEMEGGRLALAPVLPADWLDFEGRIEVRDAPTLFGLLSYTMEWDAGGHNLHIQVEPRWRTSPQQLAWKPPAPVKYIAVDGREANTEDGMLNLPSEARLVEVTRHAR